MLDDIITNKYFVIALIVILIIVLYLYSQKQSCAIEGMKNIGASMVSDDIEKPWDESDNDGKYKFVGNRKNYLNKNNKKKLEKARAVLERSDQRFRNYIQCDDDEEDSIFIKEKKQKISADFPQPLDLRPDLGQCQPCVCPGDDDEGYQSYLRWKRRHKTNKN